MKFINFFNMTVFLYSGLEKKSYAIIKEEWIFLTDKEGFKMTCPMSKVLGKSISSNYNNNIISKYLLI